MGEVQPPTRSSDDTITQTGLPVGTSPPGARGPDARSVGGMWVTQTMEPSSNREGQSPCILRRGITAMRRSYSPFTADRVSFSLQNGPPVTQSGVRGEWWACLWVESGWFSVWATAHSSIGVQVPPITPSASVCVTDPLMPPVQ